MTQSNDTGTPASGQPQGNAAAGTTIPKKYAGKYNSLEEAVELGYGGLEKGFNDLNEKFANMTRLLEAAVAPQEPVPTVGATQYGQPVQYNDPYGRTAQPQQAAVDFLMNPQAQLDARDAALMNKVSNVVTNVVTNAMAVADFKLRNPDLVKHEPIVKAFMQNTDARKSVAERLEDAAKATRSYIAQNFQPTNNPAPTGDHYVEPPRGPVTMLPPGSPPMAPGSEDDEAAKAVTEYLNERNATKAQNFGVGIENK